MSPARQQGVLDLRPPKPEAERVAEARRLAPALQELLERRHVGRVHAATWDQLRDELLAEGVSVGAVRRLQEAASFLRRVKKVAVGGDSQAGIYIVRDDVERKRIAAERVKRIRAEVAELEAFDRALYERIARALPLEEGTAA